MLETEARAYPTTSIYKQLDVVIQPSVGGRHEPNLNLNNTEVIARVKIPDTEPLVDDLRVFDVSLYKKLFNQVIEAGLTREQAKGVVAFAATYDGVGLITEKISSEKNGNGNYIFDVEDRVRMQLTPPQHFYLEQEDELTHERIMVAPEHQWGKFKKDVMANISAWRRGLDKVGMQGVKTVFLGEDDALKEGESIFWGSPRAEKWEGETIVKYNGFYGFLYWGRVVTINGQKALEVHDFKNDLDTDTYNQFFSKIDGEIYTNPLYLDHPLVDRVKASFVISTQDFTIADIWTKLGEVQKEITGKEEIFGLPTDVIIALQDPQLHQRIRADVAVPIGTWIADEIYINTPIEQIQGQARQRYIDKTLQAVSDLKEERVKQRYFRERPQISSEFNPQRTDYTSKQEGNYFVYTDPLTGKEVAKIPIIAGGASPDYLKEVVKHISSVSWPDPIDPAILTRYTGSNGDGCGSWGDCSGGLGSITFGSLVSSVSGLTNSFRGVFGGESGKKGKSCIGCGEVNYYTKNCHKCGGGLI